MKTKSFIQFLFILVLSLLFSCEEEESEIKVANVSLSKTSLELYEGSSEILTAIITPSDATIKNVEWTSSDPSIASVNQKGAVVAVKVGNATITATTYDGGKTATCIVTARQKNTFTDARDGNEYDSVAIGTQVWMAENLRYLPTVIGPVNGSKTEPFHYVYDYVGTNVAEAKATDNYETYGVLYNWLAAKTACPTGWHLPTDAEWTKLTDFIGGISSAGIFLKASNGWNSAGNGFDQYGFSALPSGSFFYSDIFSPDEGFFYTLEENGYWWSSTELNDHFAKYRLLRYNFITILRDDFEKENGLSVRCVKDM